MEFLEEIKREDLLGTDPNGVIEILDGNLLYGGRVINIIKNKESVSLIWKPSDELKRVYNIKGKLFENVELIKATYPSNDIFINWCPDPTYPKILILTTFSKEINSSILEHKFHIDKANKALRDNNLMLELKIVTQQNSLKILHKNIKKEFENYEELRKTIKRKDNPFEIPPEVNK